MNLMSKLMFLLLSVSVLCQAVPQALRKDTRRLYRDGIEEREYGRLKVGAPGTAPDYDLQGLNKPRLENAVIPAVTEVNRPAEVTAFAQKQLRQATQETNRENFSKTPSFVFELVRAIADLGHGVFALLGLATGAV